MAAANLTTRPGNLRQPGRFCVHPQALPDTVEIFSIVSERVRFSRSGSGTEVVLTIEGAL